MKKHKENENFKRKIELESIEVLEAAVNSISEYAVILLDRDGVIQSWNKGAQLIKGYTAQEIVGKHFSIFYPPHAVSSGFPAYELQKALADGKFEDEGWRVRKDGRLFWANVCITSIRNTEDEHIGFCKLTRDLTVKKETEARLQVLQCGVDCVVDYAIFMLDPLGTILTWNKGAERIKGYTTQEIIGKPYSIFIPTELPRCYAENALKNALKNGTFQDENWRVKKGGEKFWANVIITAVFNPNGEHVGFCKVTRDLTEQKKAQDRLLTLQKENEIRLFLAQEEERLRKQQSNFTDRICHEIRNPLNGILGTVKLIEMEVSNSHQEIQATTELHRESWLRFLRRLENFAAGIKECAEHQKRIADEVLVASKMDKYEIQLNSGPTKPKSVVQLSTIMFSDACAAKGVTLQVHIPETDLEVISDPHRLQEILANLVSNALKFTTTGTINVTLNILQVQDGIARFQFIVEDTGIGMLESELANLFKQFSQSSNYTNYSGTGLGLYISKQIVELMGGTIEVESTKGVGSRFTVTLQCKVCDSSKDVARQDSFQAWKTHDFSKKKILVAEDNVINQKILSSLLKHFGIHADIAANGFEAVFHAEAKQYDLILMDILMPDMDGIEATKKILASQKIPIVAVSGFGQEKDKLAAIEAGMVDYIVKPYVIEDLARILTKYLITHQM